MNETDVAIYELKCKLKTKQKTYSYFQNYIFINYSVIVKLKSFEKSLY